MVSAYLIIINTFSIWLEKVLSALIVYSSKGLSILITYCFFFLLLTKPKSLLCINCRNCSFKQSG